MNQAKEQADKLVGESLHEYSLLCGIAYSDDARESYARRGYRIVKLIDTKGIQAFLLNRNDQYYMVIRGSDELRDWVRNVNINHRSGISAGVYKAYKAIGGLPLGCIVMGHSLGGAIAHVYDKHECVSFGAPRIFYSRREMPNLIRITNCNDVAPKIPFNFKHPRCKHLHLTYSGRIVENPSYWTYLRDNVRARIRAWQKGQAFTGYYDHALVQYQSKLSAL